LGTISKRLKIFRVQHSMHERGTAGFLTRL
jgi:hypothetical protein